MTWVSYLLLVLPHGHDHYYCIVQYTVLLLALMFASVINLCRGIYVLATRKLAMTHSALLI